MMQFEWVDYRDTAQIDAMLDDPQWLIEQKMDGTRAVAVLRHGLPPVFLGRHGGPLKHTAATQHLDRITAGLAGVQDLLDDGDAIQLDGEIMIQTGQFFVFDMPMMRLAGEDAITADDPFILRRLAIETTLIVAPADSDVVRPVPGAADNKRAMFHRCERAGVEGVMFKHADGKYLHGQRSKDVLKVKFVKTADVVVTAVDRRRNDAGREVGSIEFGVMAPFEGEMTVDQQQAVTLLRRLPILPVGRCSVIGKPHVERGDVIEVAYLYWTGGTTYQPRMMRIRDDKPVVDCTADQFRPYSREAV